MHNNLIRRIRTTCLAVTVTVVLVLVSTTSAFAEWFPFRSHRLYNVETGYGHSFMMAMDNSNGNIVNGNRVVLWTRKTSNYYNQEWFEWYRDTDNAEVHYAYDATWGVTEHAWTSNNVSGTGIFLYEYLQSNDQRWYPVQYASSYSLCDGWEDDFIPPQYANCEAELLVSGPTFAIDDQYSSHTPGAYVWMWEFHGGKSQLFWDQIYGG